jgi:lysyl-tRNA synthetase class 2
MTVCTQADWKPTATLKQLQARSQLYKIIRQFFEERQVLEVETPILGEAATIDPAIESIAAEVAGKTFYLQTSPEFYLKRLLAAGSGDVYSLAKAFRKGECGRKHQPEFTLLEWYRVGWDEHQLMDEMATLFCHLFPRVSNQKVSYAELFEEYLKIDPHQCAAEELKKIAQQSIAIEANEDSKDFWLDLLMTHVIEPKLPDDLLFIYDYPSSQAALAQIDHNKNGQPIARRFETYFKKIELANGYFELLDASEQQARFEKDLRFRQENNLPLYPYDKKLIAALEDGMPSCAGVALGVDRLLMLMLDEKAIDQVISFAFKGNN